MTPTPTTPAATSETSLVAIGVWDSVGFPDRGIPPGLICTMEGVPRLFPDEAWAELTMARFLKNRRRDPGRLKLVRVRLEVQP